ncbi:MAG: copper chaperone [Sporocytophaga sp.]|nr:copper chaperone [Sporocytophaga sp.]
MKILKFKTNIHNQEMLDKIASVLNKEELISRWKVDLESQEKILSISGEEITPDIITNALKQEGIEVEMVHIIAIGGHDL